MGRNHKTFVKGQIYFHSPICKKRKRGINTCPSFSSLSVTSVSDHLQVKCMVSKMAKPLKFKI